MTTGGQDAFIMLVHACQYSVSPLFFLAFFLSFFFRFCVVRTVVCVLLAFFRLPPLFVAGVSLLCLLFLGCARGAVVLYACLLYVYRVCSSSTGAALLSPSSASSLCVFLLAACFLRTSDGSGI